MKGVGGFDAEVALDAIVGKREYGPTVAYSTT